MGDWCGPKSDTDRLKTGARNLRRSNANELIQREKKKILSPRNVRAYLTDRLMGDPVFWMTLFSGGKCGHIGSGMSLDFRAAWRFTFFSPCITRSGVVNKAPGF